MLVIMDESGFICLPPCQDHKRVGEGDTGPNTGGMGAYAPAPVITESVRQRAIKEIVNPMHHYLRNQVLFVQILLKDLKYQRVNQSIYHHLGL